MPDTDTDQLLKKVSAGDDRAADELLNRHRDRLRQLVRLRLDARLASRVDPSDVVQDTLVDAHRRLPSYARNRPIAFYPWLRRIACDRLADLQRHHLVARRRSVSREVSDISASQIANIFAGSGPSQAAARAEVVERVQQALNELAPIAFEVLMARFVEKLSVRETAESLGISVSAVKSRQLRAIQKLRERLDRFEEESGT